MTMTPGLRRFALTVHVISSVGLPGSIAAFLILAVAGLNSHDAQVVRAAYLAMDLVARFIIVPLAFASLLTGLVQSLGTSWGLFRHYWVVAKLLLTAFATAILMVKLRMIGYAAHLAAAPILPRAELGAVGAELRFHAAAGLLVLLLPAVLSLYKPRGLTPYGQRKQLGRQLPSPQPELFRPHSPRSPRSGNSVFSGGPVTLTLGRMQILGIAAVVVVAHVVIFHVIGAGHLKGMK